VTDEPLEQEVPDLWDANLECLAWRRKPDVIGAPIHHHVCRRYPEHEPPHVCHSCGATWTSNRTQEAA
jgi:hypothetical protein